MNKVIKHLLALLFPYDKCPICDDFTDGLCLSCKLKLNYLPEENIRENQKGFSLFEYNEEGKALLMAFKKRGSFYAGDDMVEFLISEKKEYIVSFDIITFAPSSKKSLRELGFDHGKYLADKVGKATGIPSLSLFEPSRIEQKKLDLESRKENAENISLRQCISVNLKGKRVLVVDDVFTTGSTVGKCVNLLENMGVHSCYVTFFKLM